MVHIGKHWRPAWFERRRSDGAYEALNAPMSSRELDIQTALLPPPLRQPMPWSLAQVGTALTALVALAGFVAVFAPA